MDDHFEHADDAVEKTRPGEMPEIVDSRVIEPKQQVKEGHEIETEDFETETEDYETETLKTF